MSREAKTHWKVKVTALWGAQYAVCGLLTTKFANKKRAVTCKTCARILAGYQTKEK